MAPAPLAGDGGGNVGPLPPNQHLHRHSLVHASLARSIKAFGRVAPLGENWGSLSWPAQLVEVYWGAGGRHLEVQALVEVSLGRHLLGGLTQEVVRGRPHTLVHLPGVEDSEENCEAMGNPTEGESRGAWGRRDWLGLRPAKWTIIILRSRAEQRAQSGAAAMGDFMGDQNKAPGPST